MAGLVLAGCPSYTLLSEVQQRSLKESYEGKLLWLHQSMHVGQFYDDERFQLMFPRAFEDIPYLRNLDGETVTPPPADGVLPVGTRVRIEEVQFPTAQAVFGRPLMTARYTTWVRLRVAAGRGDTTLMKKAPHILLLPASLATEQRFSAWLESAISEEDPNPWLSSLDDDVRQGVLDKRPVVGMSSRAVLAAMGPYDKKSTTHVEHEGRRRRGQVAIWQSKKNTWRVTLVDDVVIDVLVNGKQADVAPQAEPDTPPTPSTDDAAPVEEQQPPAEPAASTDAPAPQAGAPEATTAEPSSTTPTEEAPADHAVTQ